MLENYLAQRLACQRPKVWHLAIVVTESSVVLCKRTVTTSFLDTNWHFLLAIEGSQTSQIVLGNRPASQNMIVSQEGNVIL